MKPIYHVIISGGVSAIFAVWVRSWSAVLACFLSGIFIDLDHHLDYYLVKREIPLSYKKLVNFLRNDHDSKIHLFLHSYEFIVLLWLSIFFFDLSVVWTGVALGFTMHILCDEFANPLRPLAYFLTYRIKNRFERKRFFKKGYRD
jgi:hypothetical protein